MKVVSLFITFFVVAPFGKGEQDYLYDTIDKSTKKSIRGAPQGVSSTGQVTNTNDKPVISNNGISDSDYDKIFLDEANCLKILIVQIRLKFINNLYKIFSIFVIFKVLGKF